mmetsp:Transcript_18402/g.19021  ORF Transcript_18402/g.19021 Transcript_18402/m.19021 type:complete len:215 (-) Transcript_18402:318-962(-)
MIIQRSSRTLIHRTNTVEAITTLIEKSRIIVTEITIGKAMRILEEKEDTIEVSYSEVLIFIERTIDNRRGSDNREQGEFQSRGKYRSRSRSYSSGRYKDNRNRDYYSRGHREYRQDRKEDRTERSFSQERRRSKIDDRQRYYSNERRNRGYKDREDNESGRNSSKRLPSYNEYPREKEVNRTGNTPENKLKNLKNEIRKEKSAATNTVYSNIYF